MLGLYSLARQLLTSQERFFLRDLAIMHADISRFTEGSVCVCVFARETNLTNVTSIFDETLILLRP
jgi:hypothetical protein